MRVSKGLGCVSVTAISWCLGKPHEGLWQVPLGSCPYTSDPSKWRSKKDNTALLKALTVEESQAR